MNEHRGPVFGVPFGFVFTLLAAAILVEEPHCLANLPSCLLYVSSSEALRDENNRIVSILNVYHEQFNNNTKPT